MLSSILLSTVLAQSAYVSAQGIGPMGRPWGARAASAAAAVTWDNLGCFSDPGNARVLKGGYATTTTSASTTFCQNLCLGKGYSYTGTESGLCIHLMCDTICADFTEILNHREAVLVLEYLHRHHEVDGMHDALRRRFIADMRRHLCRERL